MRLYTQPFAAPVDANRSVFGLRLPIHLRSAQSPFALGKIAQHAVLNNGN